MYTIQYSALMADGLWNLCRSSPAPESSSKITQQQLHHTNVALYHKEYKSLSLTDMKLNRKCLVQCIVHCLRLRRKRLVCTPRLCCKEMQEAVESSEYRGWFLGQGDLSCQATFHLECYGCSPAWQPSAMPHCFLAALHNWWGSKEYGIWSRVRVPFRRGTDV